MQNTTKPDNEPQAETEQPASHEDWSTGICATAATKSALNALITGEFIDPVGIILPEGDVPFFPLVMESLGEGYAMAGIVKHACDETGSAQDITIISTVFPAPPGTGIVFQAGEGVGTVTLSGLAIPADEAAIQPLPRKMMSEICETICAQYELPANLMIMISVPDGEEIALKAEKSQHGIVGGIAII